MSSSHRPLKRQSQPVALAWDARSRLGLGLLCIALILFFGLRYDNFFTVSNAFATLLNISSIAIAAVGSGFLLISGNVDLSLGGQYALVSVVVATVAKATQSAVVPVIVGLVLGGLLGWINGTLVRLLKISPIIVTIGTAAILRGLAYVVSGGISIFGFPDSFIAIGRTYVGPAPIPVLVAAVVFIVGGFVLTRTVAGLRTYAIGGNVAATRLAGINTARFVTGLYTFNGVLIGLVATLATARLGSGTPSIGISFELDVLTAVILGGVSFSGGSGHPFGIFIGVATIAVLNTGLIFAGLQDWYQQIARGLTLLAALAADQYASMRRERSVAPAAEVQINPPESMLPDVNYERAQTSFDETLTSEMSHNPKALTRKNKIVFSCSQLSKSYGSVVAARDVTFDIASGEILCLVGDNGAGKSTVIKMISGAIQPDSGTIELDGRPLNLAGPADARAAGIETVYQDLALCFNLGAAHNMVLGREPTHTRWGVFSLRDDVASEAMARKRLSELNIVLESYQRPVGSLSGGQRQSVAIARVVDDNIKLVVLDEPTAALGVAQTRNVIELIRALAARNAAVLLVTHDIDTVFAIAHRIVVLRLGRVVFDGSVNSITQPQLVHLMAGIIPQGMEVRAQKNLQEII